MTKLRINGLQALEILVWVAVFIIFFVRGAVFLDPDFGWHIREGGLIINGGAIRADTLSYTMYGFPLVDSEWITNVGMAAIYKLLGMVGLSVLFTSVAVLAMLVSVAGVYKERRFRVAIFLLLSSLLLPFFGVRPQVVTWLFWAVLTRLLLDLNLWGRWKFLVPFWFLLWVNLHGGYMVGLVGLVVVMVVRTIVDWSVKRSDFVVFSLSVLLTLVNPYGLRSWVEVWSQVLDGTVRWNIVEWLPPIFFFSVPVAFFGALAAAAVWRYRRCFNWEQLALFGLFLLQAVSSVRHVPLWGVLSVPLIGLAVGRLERESRSQRGGSQRFGKVASFFLAATVVVFFIQLGSSFFEAREMNEERFYPKGAVEYLRVNLPKGEVLSNYGWGGYLDWKLPEKRVFIDGRMATWKWENHPERKSGNIFKEFLEVAGGRVKPGKLFAKYGVDTVLWEVSPEAKGLGSKGFLSAWLAKRFEQKKQETLLDRVREMGWKEVYRDDVAVIYEKPE